MADTTLALKAATDSLVVKGYTAQSANLQDWTDVSNNVVASIGADGSIYSASRTLGKQGDDVASANDMTLTSGNYFDITGTTTINGILITDWTAGSIVVLQFDDAPLVKHNTAASANYASILLAGAADFQASANDTLTLIYDGTTWREIARSVI